MKKLVRIILGTTFLEASVLVLPVILGLCVSFFGWYLDETDKVFEPVGTFLEMSGFVFAGYTFFDEALFRLRCYIEYKI